MAEIVQSAQAPLLEAALKHADLRKRRVPVKVEIQL
jgi:hypothetical protein